LAGRGYVVTGGTGALGRAVVAALLGAGARVAVPYRDEAGLQALRAHTGDSAALWGARAALDDRAALDAFLDAARGFLGRLDGVACLAGAYAGSGLLHEAPADEWDRMLRANLESVYGVCRAALPHLSRGGSIVTVGARTAVTGGAGAAAYAVSKAAVLALTRVLADENRERGVRVNAVAPGTIDSAANRAAMPTGDRSRWTPPEEIAGVIVFLLSPASAPVTGALVPVDARA
jgi:NAD(P)-dependent dehydrogenase (short-subunit alcohol dehydrogenase family)